MVRKVNGHHDNVNETWLKWKDNKVLYSFSPELLIYLLSLNYIETKNCLSNSNISTTTTKNTLIRDEKPRYNKWNTIDFNI